MLQAEPLRMRVYGWISRMTVNHQQCDERGVNKHFSCVCVGGLAS